tara:strand:+ start:90 stop:620 length:531 start_codon:yes stop_codon:yes gene_type:complete
MVKVPSMTGFASAGMPFGYDPMAEAYEQAIKAGVNPLDPNNKKPKPKQPEVLPKGIVATENPGVYNTTDGKPALKQGDGFVVIDSFGGFLGAPTTFVAYEEPPPDEKELTQSADTALETSIGTSQPVFADIKTPDNQVARFRDKDREGGGSGKTLRGFAGQRRSLLRPVSRSRSYF